MSLPVQYDECLLRNDFSESASEYSDSKGCSSDITSESTSDDDYEPAWTEKVGINGELFYVEPAEQTASVKNDKYDFSTEHYSFENHNFKFPLNEEKTSATERLRLWMKQRREKLKQNNKKESATRKNISSEAKFFLKENFQNDVCSSIVEVCLNVDPCKHNYGRRASLCETLLGIIIGPFDQYANCVSGTLQPFAAVGKVVVLGIVSDSEASKESDIKVGDWLKAIDDIDVGLENINDVLSSIVTPRQVKLVLQRFADEEIPMRVVSQNDSHSLCSFIKQLIGDSQMLEQAKSDYLHIPHAIFYLTLCSESDSEGDDVLYKYPDQETPLYLQKGMFITLCHTISDFASSPPLCSSLIVKEELVHVGYVTSGKEVMTLALSSACASIVEVQLFTANIEKLLKLQFLTLGRAFGDAGNREYLDHLFSLFFHNLLSPLSDFVSKPSKSHVMEILPTVHWLPVPDDLKIHIDDALSEFESADFCDMNDYGAQRLYSILGSCYFYKGYLLGSHLHKIDLLDIHLYLQHHHLLTLTKSEIVSQAIVWKEIYLTRHHQEKVEPIDSGYEETEGRQFFLIVAMQYSILAVVLEAGGCTKIAESHPPPDPLYVDQARNVLLRVESSGILSAVDTNIAHPTPPLASPDSFLKEEKSTWNVLSTFISRNLNLQLPPQNSSLGRRSVSHSNLSMESVSFSNSGSKKIQEVASILKKYVDTDGEKQQLLSNMGPADYESDTNLSLSASDETTPKQGRKHCRSLSLSASYSTESQENYDHSPLQSHLPKRNFASTYDLSYIQKMHDSCSLGNNEDIQKLVVGSENTLFHYLHMDAVEGVFLAPTRHSHDWLKGPNHKEMIDAFYNCCLKMRSVFERSLRNKELIQNGMIPKFGANTFLQAAYEQGVLFQYCPADNRNTKKPPPSLKFWVIGRLFFAPEPREVYVCLHDSAQQNVVELAFRLAFGLLL